MEFTDLVNSPPVSSAIADTVSVPPPTPSRDLTVQPVETEPSLRERAFTHLLCWWLRRHVPFTVSVGRESTIQRLANSPDDATGQTTGMLSEQDEYASGERSFDRSAAELAIDSARFDALCATSDPPYRSAPDDYALYDDAVVEELIQLVDRLSLDTFDGDSGVVRNHFGLSPSLAVTPPPSAIVIGSTAFTPVMGATDRVPADVWRELVGYVLLDDMVDRTGFRWHPNEDELDAVEGIEYTDPAEQGEVSLFTLPIAIKDVIVDAIRNQDQLGLTSVSHPELDAVGVYFAHRGELRTVPTDRIRRASGYDALRRTFLEELVSAADHDGFARIVAHFSDVDAAERRE